MEKQFLSPECARTIDSIFDAALAGGRDVLFEHEVYAILRALGLRAPAHTFVRSPDEVDADRLREIPGERLMLKIVSPAVAHKARVGGIRTSLRDAAELREVARALVRDVTAHPSFETPPLVAGILIVEKVAIAPAPDIELLIGCRHSDAFGPLLALGRGGTAVEELAGETGGPDLALAPIEADACARFVGAAKATIRYREPAASRKLAALAGALGRIGALAAHYSPLSVNAALRLQELEVNPFVFDVRGDLIPLDGFGTISTTSGAPASATAGVASAAASGTSRSAPAARAGADVPNPKYLRELLHPKGVAVAGVSATDPHKPGNLIAERLHALGRRDLVLLNPRGGAVTLGGERLPLRRSFADVAEPIDLAVVVVPAAQCPEVVAQAREKGVRNVILIPGGFSEVAGDSTIEAQVLAAAGGDLRIIGPNCMGIFFAPPGGAPGLNTFFIPEKKLELLPERESGLALIAQSGALTLTIVDKLRHAAFPRLIVSYGNQLDVEAADLLAVASEEPGVDVIGIYIEGFKPYGGRRLVNVLAGVRKPIVVYKAGRTEAGVRAAASHTAAIAGDHAVTVASLAAAGGIVADTLTDFEDFLRAFALLARFPVHGRRVAGVANAGFESTAAADNCGSLVPASFSRATTERLQAVLPPLVGVNPFLDVTPMAGEDVYEKCLEILLADDGVDAVFLSIVPHTPMLQTTDAELAGVEDDIASHVARLVARYRKPVVASMNAGTTYRRLPEALEMRSIPTYPTAPRAMRALEQVVASGVR
jgi:acyl-CoA synthetase (NDP forming)